MSKHTVFVRRRWNNWMIGEVPVEAISGLHWTDISGGVFARAPRMFIHGYVPCDALVSGEVAHSCLHGQGPHRIKVCILKKDNTKDVFELVQLCESLDIDPKAYLASEEETEAA